MRHRMRVPISRSRLATPPLLEKCPLVVEIIMKWWLGLDLMTLPIPWNRLVEVMEELLNPVTPTTSAEVSFT